MAPMTAMKVIYDGSRSRIADRLMQLRAFPNSKPEFQKFAKEMFFDKVPRPEDHEGHQVP